MQYFHFDEGHKKEGRTLYRIINDVPRRIFKRERFLSKGALGGYTEQPGLLSPESNIWLCEQVCLFGETHIYGTCLISSGYLTDCSIRGSVHIKNTRAGYSVYGNSRKFPGMQTRNILKNCVLDSSGPDNPDQPENPSISICGAVYMERCRISGSTKVNGTPHIIDSIISNSVVSGQALILHSCILDGSHIGRQTILSGKTVCGLDLLASPHPCDMDLLCVRDVFP